MKISRPASLVPALARGLEIMRLLAAEGPLAMEAVATRLSLPRSSTFRLLETLRERTGFELRVEEPLPTTPLPDAATLTAIRATDPRNLRDQLVGA